MNEALTLWMTDGRTVCHLADWLSRQMDKRIYAKIESHLQLGMNAQKCGKNYSNKQGNVDNFENQRNLTTNRNTVSLDGLTAEIWM